MAYERRTAVGWITAIGVVIAVVSYISSLPIGILDMIISPDLGVNLTTLNGSLVVEAFLLAFETPIQVNFLPILITSLIIFVICFAKAATSNGGFRAGVRTLLTGSRPRTLPNWLAVMPLVASSLLVIVVILTLVQSSVGVSTGDLTCPSGVQNCRTLLFAGIVSAPVAEEFGFRISVLGLVVAILVALRFRRNRVQDSSLSFRRGVRLFFVSFISPGYAKEQVGLPSVKTSGRRGITKVEWIFLLVTASVFGAYHIFGGGGWGPGKFASAALSGFALGVVYLAYGAFADILLHWFFNFYFEVFVVTTPIDSILMPIGNLYFLGCLALGLWGIIMGIRWIAKRKPAQVTLDATTVPMSPNL